MSGNKQRQREEEEQPDVHKELQGLEQSVAPRSASSAAMDDAPVGLELSVIGMDGKETLLVSTVMNLVEEKAGVQEKCNQEILS